MSASVVVQALAENKDVEESYVLVREVKALLNVGEEHFHPTLRIKIYQSDATPAKPFHFDVSHNVKTPEQAGPYYPTVTWAESEVLALERAIDSTVSFLKAAVRKGHTPSEEWLIPNPDF